MGEQGNLGSMRRVRRISGGLAAALGLLIVIVGAAAAAYVGPDDTVRSAPERIATDTPPRSLPTSCSGTSARTCT